MEISYFLNQSVSMFEWQGKFSHVDQLPFMGTPYPLIGLLAVYLWFVKFAGPRMMENRKPMDLKNIIIVYNIFQIAACALIVYISHYFEFTFKETWQCITAGPPGNGIYWTMLGIFVRTIELVETVFFVLRKKQNQVSNLHVYHHVSTILLLWSFFKYNSTKMELFILVLNSIIHIIMYSYYLLTVFKVLEKYLKKFKPIMTSMQLIQFVLILGQCIAGMMPSCKQSKLFYLMFVNIVILTTMFGNFFRENYTKKKSLSLIDKYPLMGSPVPLIVILLIYLWFVKYAGPKFMQDRKPFSLKWIIICYNIFQIVSCAILVERANHFGYSFKNTWKCIINVPIDASRIDMYFWQWFTLLVKLAELVETVFFVLRKKQNQVSHLHVYHHVSTILILWAFFKYSAGVMEIYIAILNSMIHIIMYSYYLLAIFKVWPKYLNMFKPIITSMQLIQFLLILGQCVAAMLPSCPNSKIFHVMFVNIVILFTMFSNFFKQNYTNPKKIT
ncbi:unnamed protein product [Diamesa serratosioi]